MQNYRSDIFCLAQNSDLLYEVEVAGPPLTMCLFGNNGGPEGDEVLYGTADGKIGLVQLGRYIQSSYSKVRHLVFDHPYLQPNRVKVKA